MVDSLHGLFSDLYTAISKQMFSRLTDSIARHWCIHSVVEVMVVARNVESYRCVVLVNKFERPSIRVLQ